MEDELGLLFINEPEAMLCISGANGLITIPEESQEPIGGNGILLFPGLLFTFFLLKFLALHEEESMSSGSV